MNAHSPEDLHTQFVASFNARDLESLMALYEKDTALVPQPGITAVGHVAIRQALEQFLAMNGRIEITTLETIQAGTLGVAPG